MTAPAKRAVSILLAASLVGCAALHPVEQLGTTDAYAKCATADVLTTTIGLATNRMHESNPIVRALAVKAFGHVGSIVVPVIGLSIAGYYLLQAINKPAVTATVTGLTCFSAARNLYLIR